VEFTKATQGNEVLTDTLNLSNKSSTSYHEMTNLSEQHCKFDKEDVHKLSVEEPKIPITKNEASCNGRIIIKKYIQ